MKNKVRGKGNSREGRRWEGRGWRRREAEERREEYREVVQHHLSAADVIPKISSNNSGR